MGVREVVSQASLLIGPVLVVGPRTPHLVGRATIEEMKQRNIIVDVDQGGSVETSKRTTLDDPVFDEAAVIHYGVKNVPASVPVTATCPLSNTGLPYARKVAGYDLDEALNSERGLGSGAAMVEGRTVSGALAREHALDPHRLQSILLLQAEAR